MKARDLVTTLVSDIAPLFKSSGFRKSALTFHRRHGATIQVVNFQLSQSNVGAVGHFYVNVGVDLDVLGAAVKERPAAWECNLNSRLRDWLSEAPSQFDVSPDMDREAMSQRLRQLLTALLKHLESVHGPSELLAIGVTMDNLLRARLHYALGNDAAALAELRDLVAYRPTLDVDRLVRQLGFTRLMAT